MYSKPCPRADCSIVQMARFYRPFRRSSAHPQGALAPTTGEGPQAPLGLWVLSGRPEGLRAYGQRAHDLQFMLGMCLPLCLGLGILIFLSLFQALMEMLAERKGFEPPIRVITLIMVSESAAESVVSMRNSSHCLYTQRRMVRSAQPTVADQRHSRLVQPSIISWLP